MLRRRRRLAGATDDDVITVDATQPALETSPDDGNDSSSKKSDRFSWWTEESSSSVEPSVLYPSSPTYSHRDIAGRVYVGPQEDRYIDPSDGSLKSLEIQASEEVLRTGGHTWKRTEICGSNLPLQLASLPISVYKSYTGVGNKISLGVWLKLFMIWVYSCISSFLVLLLPLEFEERRRNNGKFDPFIHHYRGYLKLACNDTEHRSDHHHATQQSDHWRPVFPKFICSLKQPEVKTMEGVQITRFSDAVNTTIDHKDLAYAFIAHTSNQFSETADYMAIHKMAERATRDLDLSSYWIGISCMPEPENLEADVYDLDSICRNASVWILALGNRIKDRTPSHKLDLFRDFGSRLHCRQYLFTIPPEARILVYVRGEAPESRLSLSKRELVLLVWAGHELPTALRLLDHLEGKMRLGTLEFLVLSMRFLVGGVTELYFYGEYSYVLQSLLPHRPQVDPTDSSWQAYCRLILANDTDQLLERLICHLGAHNHWFLPVTDDMWKAQLWDIQPHCQIVGFDYSDALIVDGAYAASVRWDSLDSAHYRCTPSLTTTVGRVLHRLSPVTVAVGLLLTYCGTREARTTGLILLALCLLLISSTPYLVRYLYQYDPTSSSIQPYFFGIEGYVSLEDLDLKIFGESSHPPRLRWSPNSSVLSHHSPNEFDECEGLDPMLQPHVQTFLEMSKQSKVGEPRLFTLVDTVSMTVTLFMARHPPTVVLCCGQEGGMQRALLCSFDWTTSTLYRETVLRLETSVISCMNKIGRVKLCLDASWPSDYSLNNPPKPEA